MKRHWRAIHFTLFTVMVAAAPGVEARLQQAPANAQKSDTESIQTLVRDFLKAENDFDAAKLAMLISKDFVEVSPLGEVDEHDRFLGFYAKENAVEAPPVTLSEIQVRLSGDGRGGVEIARVSYAMKNPDGSPRSLEFRATYVAQRSGDDWKLKSTQFTQIRTKPKP